MKAVILFLGLLSVPAVAADQFDLVCKGRERYSVSGKWHPKEYRYRIDLAAQRWCAGSCDGTRIIDRVSDGVLSLLDKPQVPFSGYTESLWINRRSGELRYLSNSRLGSYEEQEATCEPTAFSGFPEPVRKF